MRVDKSRLLLHLFMLSDLCCSSSPPVIVTGISDVVQMFKDDEVFVTDAARSSELVATLCHPAGHQLYSRTTFFVPETTQNVPLFHCILEKTQPHRAAGGILAYCMLA